jgi:hypothetical protein
MRKIEAVLEEFGIAGVSAGQVSHSAGGYMKVRKFRAGHGCEQDYATACELFTELGSSDSSSNRKLMSAVFRSRGTTWRYGCSNI